MTTFADMTTSGSAARLAAGQLVTRTLAAVVNSFVWPIRYWHDHQQFSAIQNMDKHQLNDLGLTPDDVTAARFSRDVLPSRALSKRMQANRTRGMTC